jgi:hypothetical protein
LSGGMDRSAEDFSRPCPRGLLAVVVKHAGAQQIPNAAYYR